MLYKFSKVLVKLYFRIFYRVEIIGLENIPDDGALICPNHFNLWDPILISIILPRKIRFMAKHELFQIPVVSWYLRSVGTYPVKRGEPDLTSIKTTLKILKDKQLVGLFPEGKRMKDKKLGTANPGVALFSIKSGKPVVPVAITGTYKYFSKLKLNFGQPIDFTAYKKDKMTNEDYYEISQIVMEHIGRLKENS